MSLGLAEWGAQLAWSTACGLAQLPLCEESAGGGDRAAWPRFSVPGCVTESSPVPGTWVGTVADRFRRVGQERHLADTCRGVHRRLRVSGFCRANRPLATEEAPSRVPLGSGASIRIRDRRVMSSNPISYAVDRRATQLRVTFRSLAVEEPAHCEMYFGHCTRTAEDVKVGARGGGLDRALDLRLCGARQRRGSNPHVTSRS
jgi:hypothetical protein